MCLTRFSLRGGSAFWDRLLCSTVTDSQSPQTSNSIVTFTTIKSLFEGERDMILPRNSHFPYSSDMERKPARTHNGPKSAKGMDGGPFGYVQFPDNGDWIYEPQTGDHNHAQDTIPVRWMSHRYGYACTPLHRCCGLPPWFSCPVLSVLLEYQSIDTIGATSSRKQTTRAWSL